MGRDGGRSRGGESRDTCGQAAWREVTAGGQLALFLLPPFDLAGDCGASPALHDLHTNLFNVLLKETELAGLNVFVKSGNPISSCLLFLHKNANLGSQTVGLEGSPGVHWYLGSGCVLSLHWHWDPENIVHSPCLSLFSSLFWFAFCLSPFWFLFDLRGQPGILTLHRQNNPLAQSSLSLFKYLSWLHVDTIQMPLTHPFCPNSQLL